MLCAGIRLFSMEIPSKKTYFPAARVTLQFEGKGTDLEVGESPHISEGMLLGKDVPHFRKLLKEAIGI